MKNLNKALDLYCQWLNKHCHADGLPAGKYDYRPDQCNPTFLYQSNHIDLLMVNEWDDGGGSLLTIYYDHYSSDVDCIIQQFDTMIDIVWRNGAFESLPEGETC